MKDQLKILIAVNSFKECAASTEIVKILSKKFDYKKFKVIPFPISDGGDGFLEVCSKHFDLEILSFRISTPYDESKISVKLGYDKLNKIIYIESAKVLGLNLIPKNYRNPKLLSSKGLGELLIQLREKNLKKELSIKKIIIGIGGTGTNDLGLGLCSQLGLRLLNKNRQELAVIPKNFLYAKHIQWNDPDLSFEFQIVTDVNNPLIGKNGATYTFGAQKGAAKKEIIEIENGFKNILKLLQTNKITDLPKIISGAGGGLAGCFQIFLNSKIISSDDFIINSLQLKKIKKDIHFIITGEGAFDRQSFMNKGSGVILKYFKNFPARKIILAGLIAPEIEEMVPNNYFLIELSKYFNSCEESIKNFKKGLSLAAGEIKQILNS